MTITFKVRRADNSEHEAELRLVEGGRNLSRRSIAPGEEVEATIYGNLRIEIVEISPLPAVTDTRPEPIMQFFTYDHLPPSLAAVSRPFCELAHTIRATLPQNAERTVALRKLLESKDAAVRAHLSV